ncbi:venom allergen 5-like [Cydia splendana]|uniref:venom allergen 5-like n=1 Tax=Cydia splendana TaxID=1100963 RepID=UPI00300DBD8C
MRITLFILEYFMLGNAFGDIMNTTKPIDYCAHPQCSMRNQHTMCVATKKISGRLYASGITTWMRYQLLLLHNRHRDNVAMGLDPGQPPAANMRKMYWDYELEEMAELWARQCQKRHDECRNTFRFNVLQNMDVRPVVVKMTQAQLLADAVDAWFSGSRVLPQENIWSFKLTNCSASGGCNSHWYSAAAWASTWRVGCSQALCTLRARSCAVFRKRRRIDTKFQQSPNVTRTTPRENLLRRTKYMTEASQSKHHFKDFSSMSSTEVPPLHRGVLEFAKRAQGEPKIMAYTFCNYGPAGNIEGYPIYMSGMPCSRCPPGTRCGDRTHRALCTVHNDPDI